MSEEQRPDAQTDTDDRLPQQDGSQDGAQDNAQDNAPKKRAITKNPLFWVILLIVVTSLVIGAVLYWLHARQFETTDDAFVDAHIVRISPQVPGQLIQVADIDNRHVEAGRLLAVIQPTGPQAQLAEAQASVSQAQAQYAQSQAQVAAAQQQAQQAIDQALAPEETAAKAERDVARYRALQRLDPAAVAGQQLDNALSTAREAQAQAQAARRAAQSALANVAVTREAATASRSAINARKAQVSQANVTLGNLQLTAPVSGQVVNRQVNVGSYVSPGTQLMAIVPDAMWITANFKETQLTLMRIGQPVSIKVDAYPDVEFKGRIDSVQRGAGQTFALLPPQNATGNYVKVVQRVPVRINFDTHNGPDPRKYPIGPGMSVVPTVKVR